MADEPPIEITPVREFQSELMGRWVQYEPITPPPAGFLYAQTLNGTHDITGHKMGCDIHVKIEVRRGGDGTPWGPPVGWAGYHPPTPLPAERSVNGIYTEQHVLHDDGFWDFRSYGTFGILADVRNYADIPPLMPPRGLPDDMADETRDWSGDYHSPTWYLLNELMLFNYDTPCENRRYSSQLGGPGGHFYDGGATCKPGDGVMTTYRAMLSGEFFTDLGRLREWATDNGIDPEDVRIIMAFDN